jgi:hypothetical protein
MANREAALGGRLPLLDPSSLEGDQRKLLRTHELNADSVGKYETA